MRVKASIVVVLFLRAAAALAAEPCTVHCVVAVDEPRAEYASAATVRVAVRNLSSATVHVTVLLDAFIEGAWVETPLSPSHPDHSFKMVQLSPVEPPGSGIAPAGSLSLAFPACAALKIIPHGGGGRDILVPCSKARPPMSSQYRLHVFVHGNEGVIEEVVSSPYRILPK